MSDNDFEARLTHQLNTYAQAGVRPIDRYAVAEAIIATGRSRRRWSAGLSRRALTPISLLLLILAFAASAVVIGSLLLDRRSAVPPPDRPVVVTPMPSDRASVGPSPTDRAALLVGDAPCAAMLSLVQTWGSIGSGGTRVPGPAPSAARNNGDLLVTGLSEQGEPWVDRVDPSSDPPALVRGDEPKRPLPDAPGFPLARVGRIIASPDGRAVAVEEGDLGQAGCGEPLVLFSGGGIRRPFPVAAFQTVTDLVWAADGSALYGVRRPTIDAVGTPYVDPDTGKVLDGPGTVLRWATRTGEVVELGMPCGSCGPLYVSPDGSRIATNDGPDVVIRDPDGTWATIGSGDELMGWSDDETLVVHGWRLSLDGTLSNHWVDPCCGGTGYQGHLSPDGSTIAGMTLSRDEMSWQVVLVDVRDGSARTIWSAPDVRGCTGFESGSSGRADCDASSSRAPGATIDPGVAISGYSRIVAWAPDGSAVALLDQQPESTETSLRIVRVDGQGASAPLTFGVPDLTASLGFPNIGPSVAWLTETTP